MPNTCEREKGCYLSHGAGTHLCGVCSNDKRNPCANRPAMPIRDITIHDRDSGMIALLVQLIDVQGKLPVRCVTARLPNGVRFNLRLTMVWLV